MLMLGENLNDHKVNYLYLSNWAKEAPDLQGPPNLYSGFTNLTVLGPFIHCYLEYVNTHH